MRNIPKKIYLQIDDGDATLDSSVDDFEDLFIGAVSWCADRINDTDIEYELVEKTET